MQISDDVLAVLSTAHTTGNTLKLAGQLNRSLYERTNKVLEAAGGKWNRKARAHLFEGDAGDRVEQILLSGEIALPQDFGWFPTPAAVAQQLVERADVRPGHRVLEPSAGRGNIALTFPGAQIDCYELLPAHVEALKAANPGNWTVTQADFLGVEPVPVYDRVVMNPPFAKRADIHHVRHALRFLAPGGRLVAVMSAGVFFRPDKLATEFRELIDARGGSIERLPDDAFKTSGTMVSTVIVVIPA